MGDRKRTVIARVVGVAFLLYWSWFLFGLGRSFVFYCRDPYVHKILTVGVIPGEVQSVLRVYTQGKGLAAVMSVSWGLFAGALATRSLLRLRPLGRCLAVMIAIDVLTISYWYVWLEGSVVYDLAGPFLVTMVCLPVLWFFFRGPTSQLFQRDQPALGSGGRIVLSLYAVVISARLLSIPAFMGFVSVTQCDLYRGTRLIPVRAEYETADTSYLDSECREYGVFDYTIRLPKQLEIKGAFPSIRKSDWTLWLAHRDELCGLTWVMLGAETPVVLSPLARGERPKFETPYEVERKMTYPSWVPGWMMINIFLGPVDRIEDVTAPHWKGFVRIVHSETSRYWVRSSMYADEEESSAYLWMSSCDGAMSFDQARQILSSLSFEGEQGDTTLFEQGRRFFTRRQYVDAGLSFFNASFVNPENAMYPYWFARSMYENWVATRDISNLRMARTFLTYGMQLDPDLLEAEELLILVNKDFEQLDPEECEVFPARHFPRLPVWADLEPVQE